MIDSTGAAPTASGPVAGRGELRILDHVVARGPDPAAILVTCADRSAPMERTCRLIRRCGSFLSCSDDD